MIRRLLPVVVYAAAALFITHPLITVLETHAAGAAYGDSFEYIRLAWWAKYALQNGLNPFYQNLLVYPGGFFSATQAAQPLIYWPITLLSFVMSATAAFNLWLLIMIALMGLGGYWLCAAILRDLGFPPQSVALAALIGGLIFCAFPATQGHLSAGHINPLSNYALPVVALALYRLAFTDGGPRWIILAALALWILALGNFTGFIYGVMPLVLFGGMVWLLRRDMPHRLHTLRRLIFAFALAGILIVPFYAPLVAEALAPDRPAYLNETGRIAFSADLLSFVAPSPFTSWLQPVVPEYARRAIGVNATEGAAYLGIAAVGLAGLALRGRSSRKAARLWLAVALGCMIFSLGGALKVGDQPAQIEVGDGLQSYLPLPYALLQNLPLIEISRTPGRFNMTTGLALGVLAALGLAALLGRLQRPAWRYGLIAALAGLILLEYQLFAPFPVTPTAIPAYFHDLAARSDVRAVLDVPHDDRLAQKSALLFQTAHHKSLLGGYVSRATPANPAKLALLSEAVLDRLPGKTMNADQVVAMLRQAGADVVVIHKALLDDLALAYAESMLGQPVYQDAQIAVFETPPIQPVAPFSAVTYGPGWVKGTDWAWMGQSAPLYVYVSAAPRGWRLNFDANPIFGPQRAVIRVEGGYAGGVNIDREGRFAWWMPEESDFQESGFQTVNITAADGCWETSLIPACTPLGACALETPRCLSLGIAAFAPEPVEDSAWRALPVGAALGRDMTLTRALISAPAGDAYRPSQTVDVVTFWEAAERLPGDYHQFFHLLDASGQFAAQADLVPAHGAYPTGLWDVPQRWVGEAVLTLPAALPAGTYRLFTGWYSYPDMTRLPMTGDSPGAADGLIFLGAVEVR